MSVFTLTSADAGSGTRKRAQRRSERLSSSRNSVSVHSNDDRSDEVFVCPETAKHTTAEMRQ